MKDLKNLYLLKDDFLNDDTNSRNSGQWYLKTDDALLENLINVTIFIFLETGHSGVLEFLTPDLVDFAKYFKVYSMYY